MPATVHPVITAFGLGLGDRIAIVSVVRNFVVASSRQLASPIWRKLNTRSSRLCSARKIAIAIECLTLQ